MVSRSPTAHFLGLELATDQLRAAVVDEQLDLIGVEVVDFDSELPEFQCVFRLYIYSPPYELFFLSVLAPFSFRSFLFLFLFLLLLE